MVPQVVIGSGFEQGDGSIPEKTQVRQSSTESFKEKVLGGAKLTSGI